MRRSPAEPDRCYRIFSHLGSCQDSTAHIVCMCSQRRPCSRFSILDINLVPIQCLQVAQSTRSLLYCPQHHIQMTSSLFFLYQEETVFFFPQHSLLNHLLPGHLRVCQTWMRPKSRDRSIPEPVASTINIHSVFINKRPSPDSNPHN